MRWCSAASPSCPSRTRPAEALAAAACWDAPLAMATGPGTELEHLQWVLEEAKSSGSSTRLALDARQASRGTCIDGAASALARHAGPSSTEIVLQADLTVMTPGPAPVDSATCSDRSPTSSRRGERPSTGSAKPPFVEVSTPVCRRPTSSGSSGARRPRGAPTALLSRRGRGEGARLDQGRSGEELRPLCRRGDRGRRRAGRKCSGLALRTVAPTVLVSPHPPEVVLTSLRSAGYMPAHEDDSGGLVVAGHLRRRATSPVVRTAVPTHGGDDRRERAAATARRLLTAGLGGNQTGPGGRTARRPAKRRVGARSTMAGRSSCCGSSVARSSTR